MSLDPVSLPYPSRENLEIFLCIYLPGCIIAAAFLILTNQEHWIENIIIGNNVAQNDVKQIAAKEVNKNDLEKEKEKEKDSKRATKLSQLEDYIKIINTGLIFAIYTFYFIAIPFIFGTLVDGLRHSSSRFGYYFCKYEFLRWRYPTKAGYMKWVSDPNEKSFNEVIYLREVDKSHLLFHAYEFFGNVACSIITIIFIYEICPSDPNSSYKDTSLIYPITFGIFILCLICMYVFWKENEEHCKTWGLYLDEEYQNNKKNPKFSSYANHAVQPAHRILWVLLFFP